MSNPRREDELPQGHLLQLTCFILFLAVWFLDSFVFGYSTFLVSYLPWSLRLALALSVVAIGLVLVELAHSHLHGMKAGKLVTTGIYQHVRHPLYLGTLLLYLPFILWTFSLLSLVPWFVAMAAYNKMASYEEQVLTNRFGKEYTEYRKRVRKWI